jgi:nitroreductase
MEVFHAILGRRSIRNYLDKPVEDEKLLKVLEAARWAPSSRNTQPWTFIVVKNEETRKKLKELAYGQDFVHQAPVVLVVCTKEGSNWVNIGLAIQNICLEAYELGLGTCIVGWFDREKTKELLGVPNGWEVAYLIPLGYPAESPKSNRRKLDEIIRWEKW